MGRLYAQIRAKFPKKAVEEERANCVTSAVPRKQTLEETPPAADVFYTDDTQKDFSADVSTEELGTGEMPTAIADDLPIYEAPAKEIEYWHAFGSNGFLQDLLREYELDYSNPSAYQHFKIGFDEQNHRATLAIDDTHYYAIDFDKYNATPLNRNQARAVLEKISAIRLTTRRFKAFGEFQIECFD